MAAEVKLPVSGQTATFRRLKGGDLIEAERQCQDPKSEKEYGLALLARRVRGEATGGWAEIRPTVATYWLGVRKKVVPVHAGGRLKQWLAMMRRNYPEAEVLYDRMRPIKAAADIDAAMIDEGLVTREQLAA